MSFAVAGGNRAEVAISAVVAEVASSRATTEHDQGREDREHAVVREPAAQSVSCRLELLNVRLSTTPQDCPSRWAESGGRERATVLILRISQSQKGHALRRFGDQGWSPLFGAAYAAGPGTFPETVY